MGKIVAVCTSENTGERKKNIGRGILVVDHGLEGDAHAGPWHRQVSILAIESIRKMQEKGLDVSPGDFAENITTEGIELITLAVGTKLRLGSEAVGEVTQIGKECHSRCAIYYQAGDCVMPREGIFLRVLKGGPIKVGDNIEILETPQKEVTDNENRHPDGQRQRLPGRAARPQCGSHQRNGRPSGR